MTPPRTPFAPRDYPDHHDAELVLRVYELRRDPVMREARAAINTKFLPRTLEEMVAVAGSGHELNAAFRQVSSYWEMVYAMARYGVVHSEFLMESNGEGMLLFARVSPYLEQYRQATSPRALRNAQWVSEHSELGKQIFAANRERVAKALAAK